MSEPLSGSGTAAALGGATVNSDSVVAAKRIWRALNHSWLLSFAVRWS